MTKIGRVNLFYKTIIKKMHIKNIINVFKQRKSLLLKMMKELTKKKIYK